MAGIVTPLSGCQKNAAAWQTAMASSKLHLFKSSFTPSVSTTKAEFEENEADYTGYAEATITAWLAPILAPGAGFMVSSPTTQFTTGSSDPTVGNVIGGCWVEDSAGAVRLYVVFDQPVPMQLAYQGIPITLSNYFLTGQ